MRAKRGNGEGMIRYDQKRKEYIGSIMKDGKRYYFYSGKGGKRSTVVAKMNQWRIDHNAEESEDKPIRRTVEVEINEWMENVKKPALKPTTYDRLEFTVNCHIIPNLGSYYLDELTDTIIKKELMDKIGLSYSSVRKVYDAMNGFLRYMAQKDRIPSNPMDSVAPPSNKATVDASADIDLEEHDDVEPLTVDEMKRLKATCLDVCAKNGQRRYVNGSAYLLVMNTGIRMGEALALQWSDVDFEKKTVAVTKNLAMVIDRENATEEKRHKLVIQNTPKTTKSWRVIPLNKEALAALHDLKTLTGTDKTKFIIHTELNSPMAPRNFSRGFRYICRRAGIKTTGVHALRHTYATRLFEKGVDIKIISELLGHSSVQITYRVYVHVIERLKKQAVEALDLL